MHHEALIGQILDDHYKIVASLGSGGMAMVFKAEQLGLKRFVAIKIMHISPLQDKDSQARLYKMALENLPKRARTIRQAPPPIAQNSSLFPLDTSTRCYETVFPKKHCLNT